jgi:hypothetical protein
MQTSTLTVFPSTGKGNFTKGSEVRKLFKREDKGKAQLLSKIFEHDQAENQPLVGDDKKVLYRGIKDAAMNLVVSSSTSCTLWTRALRCLQIRHVEFPHGCIHGLIQTNMHISITNLARHRKVKSKSTLRGFLTRKIHSYV